MKTPKLYEHSNRSMTPKLYKQSNRRVGKMKTPKMYKQSNRRVGKMKTPKLYEQSNRRMRKMKTPKLYKQSNRSMTPKLYKQSNTRMGKMKKMVVITRQCVKGLFVMMVVRVMTVIVTVQVGGNDHEDQATNQRKEEKVKNIAPYL